EGIAPIISTAGLLALKEALENNDPALIQGATTVPPPLQSIQDWPVEAACPLSLTGWRGEHFRTVGQVEEYFARVCYYAGERLGDSSGARWFLNWVDDTPREQMRQELLAEVVGTLAGRSDAPPAMAA